MLDFLLFMYDRLYNIIFTMIIAGFIFFFIALGLYLIDYIPSRYAEYKYIHQSVNKTCEDYIKQVSYLKRREIEEYNKKLKFMKRKAKRKALIEYRKMQNELNGSYIR